MASIPKLVTVGAYILPDTRPNIGDVWTVKLDGIFIVEEYEAGMVSLISTTVDIEARQVPNEM